MAAARWAAPWPNGFVHAGPVGAGHFAKMTHNGIEYATMAAYGDGYAMLTEACKRGILNVDPVEVLESWLDGTVIRSWMLELLVKALHENPGLQSVLDIVPDSGMGQWFAGTAFQWRLATPVIIAALLDRFRSQHDVSPSGNLTH